MTITAGKLAGMNAVADDRGVIAAAAMDQRGSLKKALEKEKGAAVSDAMMEEFKTLVTEVLTPHASAILLDPEWGLPASKKRAKNAGLLLAYEKTGYDKTGPGRLPDLLDEYGKISRDAKHPLGRAEPGAEAAFLLENLPRTTLRSFVDYDGSRAAIRLRCHVPTSSQVLALERRILDFAKQEFGEAAEVRVTGEPVLTAHLCELVTDRLVSNLAILSIVVAGLIALIVRSLRQGIIALVPNLFPIVRDQLDIGKAIGARVHVAAGGCIACRRFSFQLHATLRAGAGFFRFYLLMHRATVFEIFLLGTTTCGKEID